MRLDYFSSYCRDYDRAKFLLVMNCAEFLNNAPANQIYIFKFCIDKFSLEIANYINEREYDVSTFKHYIECALDLTPQHLHKLIKKGIHDFWRFLESESKHGLTQYDSDFEYVSKQLHEVCELAIENFNKKDSK